MDYGCGNRWHQLGLLGLAAVLLLTFWAGLWYQSRRLEPAVLVSEGQAAWDGSEAQKRDGEDDAVGAPPPGSADPEGTATDWEAGLSQADGPLTKTAEGVLAVHVVGQVRKPGVYDFPEGSGMDDAVLSRLNLAMLLQDGLQIRDPKLGEADPCGQGQLIFYPEDSIREIRQRSDPWLNWQKESKVDLNTAGQAELETLPGIGPALAQRILEDRRAHGPYKRLEDLDRVKGIGGSLINGIRDRAVCGA